MLYALEDEREGSNLVAVEVDGKTSGGRECSHRKILFMKRITYAIKNWKLLLLLQSSRSVLSLSYYTSSTNIISQFVMQINLF